MKYLQEKSPNNPQSITDDKAFPHTTKHRLATTGIDHVTEHCFAIGYKYTYKFGYSFRIPLDDSTSLNAINYLLCRHLNLFKVVIHWIEN